jgi:hypothetical protein
MAAMGAPARRVLAFDRSGTTRTDSLRGTLKRIEPVTRADVPTLCGARWSSASRHDSATAPRWPHFGRPAMLNTAALCAAMSSILAGQQRNGQVAGARDTVYGSEGWFGRPCASHKPFAIMRQRLLLLMSPTHAPDSSSVASAASWRSSGTPTAPRRGRSHRSHTDEARRAQLYGSLCVSIRCPVPDR